MSNEEQLRQAMRDLRDLSAGGASHVSETRMLSAFRKQHSRRGAWKWAGLGAVAASVLIVSGLRVMNPGSVQAPEVNATPLQPVVAGPPTPVIPEKRTIAKTNIKKPIRTKRAIASQPVQPSEDYAFQAIRYAPPISAGDALQVIRVQLPVEYGRRIEADVLSGQDGIARAIRFVR